MIRGRSLILTLGDIQRENFPLALPACQYCFYSFKSMAKLAYLTGTSVGEANKFFYRDAEWANERIKRDNQMSSKTWYKRNG
jgi:hypothetical protein